MEPKPASMNTSFNKGTLPGWFTVILLGVITYMGRDYMDDLRQTKALSVATDKRVTVLELQSKSLDASISDLRVSQKEILGEIRVISAQLAAKK